MYRAAAEFCRDSRNCFAVAVQAEDFDGDIFATVKWLANAHHVFQASDFDQAFNRQIRTSTAGEFSSQLNVDRDSVVLNGGINSADTTVDNPVSRVDLRELPDEDVPCLNLRNL